MKLPTALLCAVSAAALAGTLPAADGYTPSPLLTASAQDTTARRPQPDTTARKNPPRRKPTPAPRYCPACGMG